MYSSLKVDNLCVSYQGKEAVKEISFSIMPGKIVGIIGPNGAGKSTLIKAILQLIKIDKGDVLINGRNFTEQRKRVAYVPQRNDIDWSFPINVLDTVLLGTYPKLGLFKKPKKTEIEWAFQCLEKVGMEELSKRQIGELSGGQQQRVFLARALAQRPDVFLLDEPFVGIDVSSEAKIMSILKDLKTDGKTILVVHHDLSKVTDYFNQVMILNKELIGFGDTNIVFHPDILSRAYSSQYSIFNKVGVGI